MCLNLLSLDLIIINVNFIYFNVIYLCMDSKALFLILALTVLAAPYVLAVTPAGGSVQGTAADQGAYPSSSGGTIDVEAGNIYLANVTGEQSTYHWAGVYGNATGTLVLGDSSTPPHKMYEWPANATYVFFDDDSTINWDNLDTATCSDVETSFNFLSGASDDCDSTLTTTHDPSFKAITDIGATVAGQTYDSSGSGYWWTLAIKDNTAEDVIFVGEVDNNYHSAYNGDTVNYQVILPENGENGDTGTTTYYIWIELY